MEVSLTLPNPNYNEIINKYNDLGGIRMHDTDTKNLLPIHNVLGAGDKIKMGTCPRVGQIGESFTEQTKMGCVITLPGRESDVMSTRLTKTSANNYEVILMIVILISLNMSLLEYNFIVNNINQKPSIIKAKM